MSAAGERRRVPQQAVYYPPPQRRSVEPESARERRAPQQLYVPPRRRQGGASSGFNRASSPGFSTCSEIVTSWRQRASPPRCCSPSPLSPVTARPPTGPRRRPSQPAENGGGGGGWRQSGDSLNQSRPSSRQGAPDDEGSTNGSPKKRSGRRRRRSGRRSRSQSEDHPSDAAVSGDGPPHAPWRRGQRDSWDGGQPRRSPSPRGPAPRPHFQRPYQPPPARDRGSPPPPAGPADERQYHSLNTYTSPHHDNRVSDAHQSGRLSQSDLRRSHPDSQPSNRRSHPDSQPSNRRSHPDSQPSNHRSYSNGQPDHQHSRPDSQPGHQRSRPDSQLDGQRSRPDSQPGHQRPRADGDQVPAGRAAQPGSRWMAQTDSGDEAGRVASPARPGRRGSSGRRRRQRGAAATSPAPPQHNTRSPSPTALIASFQKRQPDSPQSPTALIASLCGDPARHEPVYPGPPVDSVQHERVYSGHPADSAQHGPVDPRHPADSVQYEPMYPLHPDSPVQHEPVCPGRPADADEKLGPGGPEPPSPTALLQQLMLTPQLARTDSFGQLVNTTDDEKVTLSGGRGRGRGQPRRAAADQGVRRHQSDEDKAQLRRPGDTTGLDSAAASPAARRARDAGRPHTTPTRPAVVTGSARSPAPAVAAPNPTGARSDCETPRYGYRGEPTGAPVPPTGLSTAADDRSVEAALLDGCDPNTAAGPAARLTGIASDYTNTPGSLTSDNTEATAGGLPPNGAGPACGDLASGQTVNPTSAASHDTNIPDSLTSDNNEAAAGGLAPNGAGPACGDLSGAGPACGDLSAGGSEPVSAGSRSPPAGERGQSPPTQTKKRVSVDGAVSPAEEQSARRHSSASSGLGFFNMSLEEPFDWADDVEEWEQRCKEEGDAAAALQKPAPVQQSSGRSGTAKARAEPAGDAPDPPTPSPDPSMPSHVIEVYNFPPTFSMQDFSVVFQDFVERGFDVRQVDESHALAIFENASCAAEALRLQHPMVLCRPLSQATALSRQRASRAADVQPAYRRRPETSSLHAGRLVASALGLRSSQPQHTRDKERRKLLDAKDRKRHAAKQRDDAWEGRF